MSWRENRVFGPELRRDTDKAAHLSVSWQTETVIGLDAAYLLGPVSNAWTVGLRVTL